MTEQNNQNKEDEFEYDDEIEYDPQVDKILVEAELKLREIKGWDNLKTYVDCTFFNKHPAFDLPVYDLKGWSKAFLYIMQFDMFLKEDTDLFNEEEPIFPPELDNEIITANDIENYRKSFEKSLNDFRGWLERMIMIAPQAFENEKFDWLKEYSPIEDPMDLIDIVGVPKIEYEGEDPQRYQNIALSFEGKKEWPQAIENVKKSLKAFDESPFKYPFDYSIYNFIRIPLFIHQSGNFEEAWKVFDDYLNGNFPVKTPIQNGLNHHIVKTWECRVIYQRMRVCSVKQKKYKDAFIYRALDLFYEIGTIFFLKESNLFLSRDIQEDDSKYLASFVQKRFFRHIKTDKEFDDLFKEYTDKKILNKHLKTRFKMAKLNVDLDKVSELICEAVEILPDYNVGEKLIKDFLKNK